MSRTEPITGGNATIIFYNALVGMATHGEAIVYDQRVPVIDFSVRPPRPHAQHPASVDINYTEIEMSGGRRPRRMKRRNFRTMLPTDIDYCIIELTVDGERVTFYDSRTEVPCNMTAFNAFRQRNQQHWGLDRIAAESRV
jgi:hypothetical protein